MTNDTPQAVWNYPTKIHVGAGRFSGLAEHCAALGMKRPLIVTDAGLAGHPMIASARRMLDAAGLGSAVFADVQGNPIHANLLAGNKVFLAGKHDGVVAIGGGSGLDIAKLIAVMVRQTIPVWDLEDIGDWWTRADASVIAPVLAVPTTAGTGSEVGRCAVITNEETEEKKIIFHPEMMPALVIADPELTTGLPPHLTAATGMDALTHCFETFCVNAFHPMADGIALEGMRLIKAFLPKAVANGQDMEARTMMMAAALMGGVSFQKGLGAVHSLAHPLGAIYGVHHGLTNAVLLPYVMAFNRPAIEEKAARVAHTLDVGSTFDDLLRWVLDFRRVLGVPHSLAGLGIGLDRADAVALKAQADPSTSANPRKTTPDDMKKIFAAAVAGDLAST